MRLLAIAFLVTVLSSASYAAPADHQIDPNTDIVISISERNPKHELIIYLSPGCPGCLTAYEKSFPTILREYVAAGDLSVVIRQVPQVYHFIRDQEKAKIAGQMTLSLAVLLQCLNETVSAEGVGVAIYKLAKIYMKMRSEEGKPGGRWPYLDEDGKARLTQLIQKYELADLSKTSGCYAPEKREVYFDRFKRNADIVKAARSDGRVSAPTYFLDGVEIPFGSDYGNLVLQALERLD